MRRAAFLLVTLLSLVACSSPGNLRSSQTDAGSGGSAGAAGSAGTGGKAGAGGTAGTAGDGGLAGSGGTAGSSGSGGTGGSTTLGGVGSASDSLTKYPKTGAVTTGDYYVDPTNGNDANSGTTLAKAFKTLGKALSAVAANPPAGNKEKTILVTAGILKPSTRWNLDVSGAGRVNIYGYGTDRPIIDCQDLAQGSAGRVFDIFSGGATWHIKTFWIVNGNGDPGNISIGAGASGNVIEDVWVSHYGAAGPSTGVYMYNASNNIVQDCAFFRMGDGSNQGTNVGDAIGIGASAGNTSTGNKLVRNFAANQGDDSFDTFYGQGTLMQDNVSYQAGLYWNGNPAADGNAFKCGGNKTNDPHGGGTTAIGNLAVGSTQQGFDYNDGAPANTYEHNTAVDCGGYGFYMDIYSTRVETASDNIAYNNGTNNNSGGALNDSNNTWNLGISNPGFADPAHGDYSLSAGSPCIGKGTGSGNLGASTVALEIAKRWIGDPKLTAASPAP